MKKPDQFLPLLKQMLGFYRFGFLPLFLYELAVGIILCSGAIFSPGPVQWIYSYPESQSGPVQLMLCGFLWSYLCFVSTAAPLQLLGGVTSIEFILTRAVNRVVWLRAERVFMLILVAAPLAVNLAVSPWEPEMVLEPSEPGIIAPEAQARYAGTFPSSQLTTNKSTHGERLTVPRGTEMFAAWMLWAALSAIFLVAGYFTIIFSVWQRSKLYYSKSKWRDFLAGAIIFAPSFLVVPVFLSWVAWGVNWFEWSFLFFARHTAWSVAALLLLIVLVQPLSERNIQKLEFE
jgi:hypothetical protein